MALEDSSLSKGLLAGVAVGAGLVLLAPIVIPAVASASKPLARAAARTGMIMLEKGRETIAELGEVADDFVAETRAGMARSEALAEDDIVAAQAGEGSTGERTAGAGTAGEGTAGETTAGKQSATDEANQPG